MAKNKWMDQLSKLDGALNDDTNPFNTIIESPSPSVNFTFGNTHGLPLGYTTIFWGPSEGGKSLLSNLMIGQMHKDYPDGIAIKFDTEMRSKVQLTPQRAKICGIDMNRYKAIETNTPSGVFDAIKQDINAMCQDGAPIKIIVIDSISNILGRRTENADSIDVQQMGDAALTLSEGVGMILSIIRKHNIALILIAHERAELDQLEIRRHKKVRMQAAKKVVHFAEYVLYVEPNKNADGKEDLLKNSLINEQLTDMTGKGDSTVMKVKATMMKNNLGPKGRTGQFTFDLNNGIINTHEELFVLGNNRGVILHPNNVTFSYLGKDYRGKEAMLEAIKNSTEIQNSIIKELKEYDLSGKFATQDAEIAKEMDNIPDIE